MTNILEVLLVGLVLCADSFSAALAMGARTHKFSDSLKFAFTSGGAEALVSFCGAIAGAKIISEFDSIDHWVSFLLLVTVALHMSYENFNDFKKNQTNKSRKFHGLTKIIIVSFATSLDAFAVGMSLGVSEKNLAPYIASIGLWTFFSTIIGMSMAKIASQKIGSLFSLLGSIVLLTLAFKFLIEGL